MHKKIIQEIEYDYQNYIQYLKQIRQNSGYYMEIEIKKWNNLYNILKQIKIDMINQSFNTDDIDNIRICIYYIDSFFDIMQYERRYDCNKFITTFDEIKTKNIWNYVQTNIITYMLQSFEHIVLDYYIKNNGLRINFSELQVYYPIEIFKYFFSTTNKDRINTLNLCLYKKNIWIPIEIIEYTFTKFIEL